jgi:DNA helicase-2/ATP-dependent DNA helicase PcrA
MDEEITSQETIDQETICNLQQVYQELLSCLRLREEDIPPSTAGAPCGAAVMTSLGTLSRAIDEYDLLHFRQPPVRKLVDFAGWLQSEAPLFYEDVGETGGQGTAALAEANAVTICTVHKAKGKEWAVVFVPGLAEGRFPHSGQQYGRTKWHILPREAVRDAARYDTTLAEETRLMYVAVTRAKKFLTCTFAPDLTLAQPLPRSSFLTTFAHCPGVQIVTAKTIANQTIKAQTHAAQTATDQDRELVQVHKLPPAARIQKRALVLTFSQLAAYLRCPYLFKLRMLYGWAAPPNAAEGFGKSNHDALSEVHTGAIAGMKMEGEPAQIAAALTERHLLLPYTDAEGYQVLAQAAARQLTAYLTDQQAQIASVTYTEAPFEIILEGETRDDGLTITGRNDVIWSLGGEETLREIKSRREAQSEEVTRVQLYTEDLGFHASTGRHVSHLEAYNLAGEGNDLGVQFREAFDSNVSEAVKKRLRDTGQAIRRRELMRLPVYDADCQQCDHVGLCRDTPGTEASINHRG